MRAELMHKFFLIVVLVTSFCVVASPESALAADKEPEGPFKPTWESIRDNYEVPEWFRDAKLGIYVHWGVYSVAERGEWYGRRMYQEDDPVYVYHLKTYGHPSEFGYKDLIPLWKAENFDPNSWLELFKEAGARYFTPCAVHHDGFDLWDSKYQPFNAVKMGPKKDLLGMLRAASLKHGLRFGVTSHLARSYCWFQTSHGADTEGHKKGIPYDGRLKEYEALYHETHGDTAMRYPAVSPAHWKLSWKLRMTDLIDNYQPDLIYLDGALPFLDDKGQTGFEVLAHYYNEGLKRHDGKKEVMLTYKGSAMTQEKNKGWFVSGIGTRDYERDVPDRLLDESWQTDDSIGPWGYNTTVPYTSVDQLVDKLVDIVSKNGNLLLNVPPKADGTFDRETINILKELGKWNRVNGEAIFGTRPWIRFGEGPVKAPQSRARVSPFSARDIRFTTRGNILYAILLDWPGGQAVVTSLARSEENSGEVETISLLGHEGKLEFIQDTDGLKVKMPAEKPCDYAFVLKITGLKNELNSTSLSGRGYF
jgi:alpha-L-fucosidase